MWWRRWGKPFARASLISAAVVAATLPTACGEGSAAPGSAGAPEPETSQQTVQGSYRARLEPLAGSGAEGAATLSMLGTTLRLQLSATGLEPREEHVQHVHRLESGEPGVCPTRGEDEDGDGLLTLREAMPVYGPVALPLEPFPRADRRGRIDFQGTFELPAELQPLDFGVIVLYGRDVHRLYDPTVPVACGRIH